MTVFRVITFPAAGPVSERSRWTDKRGSMFGWLRRSPTPTVRDSKLGELRFEKGCWWGSAYFEAAHAQVQLSVPDADGRPAANASALLEEFADRYSALRPAFAIELRRLLEPWHEQFWPEGSLLENGEALLARFELDAIAVGTSGIDVAGFTLKEGWDDASFRVSVEGWTPKGLGIDD